jgi:hypothetical protein
VGRDYAFALATLVNAEVLVALYLSLPAGCCLPETEKKKEGGLPSAILPDLDSRYTRLLRSRYTCAIWTAQPSGSRRMVRPQ